MRFWRIGILLLGALVGGIYLAEAQDSVQTHLISAIELGDLTAVKDAVKKGADVNMTVVATRPDYLFFISRKLFLEGMRKSRPGDIVYIGPMHANASHVNLKILQYLRKKKANIDAGDSDGKTPLMYALRSPVGEEYALYLLEKGANYRSIDVLGNTVMHYAAYGGNIQGLRMTAGGGIDINVRNQEGITPLHAAAVFSKVEVLQEIMGLGGDIHALDSAGFGTLHYAAAYGDPVRLQWILEQAPEQNVASIDGTTPLDIARAAGNVEAALFLQRNGGKVGNYRHQEMLEAIRNHDREALRAILKDGADPNRKTDEYPLMVAVMGGDHFAAQLLLEAGARVDVVSKRGDSPMKIAIGEGKPVLGQVLIQGGASADSRMLSVCMDHVAKEGNSYEWIALIKAMLPKVPDLDASAGLLNIPPLHYAAYIGQEELVKALLEAHSNPNARDADGWTALHWAVMKRDLLRLHLEKLRIAEQLAAAGAEINPKSTAPKTLLHTEPYLARRVPGNATPFDLLNYAPPKDADLADFFATKGGVSGLSGTDFFENGLALFHASQFQTAQIEFGKAILANPKHAEAYYYRARCMSMQSFYAEVERELNKAIELKPIFPEAFLARAKARFELEKYPAAKVDVQKAMDLGFLAGECLYWRGKIKLRMDDRDGACEDFHSSGDQGFVNGTEAETLYCR